MFYEMWLEIESIVIIILMLQSLYFNNKKEDPQCVFCDVNKSDIILKTAVSYLFEQ